MKIFQVLAQVAVFAVLATTSLAATEASSSSAAAAATTTTSAPSYSFKDANAPSGSRGPPPDFSGSFDGSRGPPPQQRDGSGMGPPSRGSGSKGGRFPPAGSKHGSFRGAGSHRSGGEIRAAADGSRARPSGSRPSGSRGGKFPPAGSKGGHFPRDIGASGSRGAFKGAGSGAPPRHGKKKASSGSQA